MKANEFRIGNKIIANVAYRGEVKTFSHLSDDYSVVFFSDGSIHGIGEYLKDCEPVPLTTDTLLKSGFTFDRDNERFVIDVLGSTLYLRKAAQGGFLWGFVDDNEEHILFELFNVKPIKYVHKLQNLYFALTDGEELPMNVLLINEGDKSQAIDV